ncbi:hypothetical protein [Neisseria perflava]|uniref:hypothetical protein n=1 Tax=Neisseria perflava TaxID=33053 RepID=UPI00209D2548|nr:hypothetical protein [Neisseria perflava]MCP1661251.1 hypothetical protein [Neisseria perflava]MCP1772261.1 hypothetical protein [Neisseria perflava]
MLKLIFIAPAFTDCTPEQLDSVIDILSEQPKLITQIRGFAVARNAGLSGEQPGVDRDIPFNVFISAIKRL